MVAISNYQPVFSFFNEKNSDPNCLTINVTEGL